MYWQIVQLQKNITALFISFFVKEFLGGFDQFFILKR
jgi:hypothetical protein